MFIDLIDIRCHLQKQLVRLAIKYENADKTKVFCYSLADCLIADKSQATYEKLLDAIKEIFPSVVVEMMQNDPDFNTEDVRDLLHQYVHQNGGRRGHGANPQFTKCHLNREKFRSKTGEFLDSRRIRISHSTLVQGNEFSFCKIDRSWKP